MKPTSLRLALVAVVISLQLVSVCVVNMISTQQLDEQAQTDATATLLLQADELVEKTRLFLIPAFSQLTVASQLITDGMLDSQRNRQLATFFRSQLRSNPWLKGMHLARSDGSLVQVGRYSALPTTGIPTLALIANHDSMTTKTIDFVGENRQINFEEQNETTGEIRHWQNNTNQPDPRQQMWYRDARSKNQLAWSNVDNFASTEQPTIFASMPVSTQEGLDAGVLVAAIDLEALTAFISHGNGVNYNSAVLIDASGQVIAHSTTYAPQAPASTHNTEPQQDNASLLALHTTAQTKHLSAPNDNAARHSLALDNKIQMELTRPVKLFGGAINWTLFVTQPHWTEFKHSDNILSSGMRLTAIIIATPGVIALMVIMVITGPVYRLYSRATKDQLTQAFNREEFEKKLEHRLLHTPALVPENKLLVVALDLDGFKNINDSFGHPAGDAVLKITVKRLLAQLHKTDVLGRLGGDEFAFFCEIDEQHSPIEHIESIRQQIVSQPVVTPNGSHHFGMTVGVSIVNIDDTVSSVMKRADYALIMGKRIKKNHTYLEFDEQLCNAENNTNPQHAKSDPTAA